jgi:hypothetical protein
VQPNVLNAVGIKNISNYEWTTPRMCSVAHAHQHLAQLDVSGLCIGQSLVPIVALLIL